MLSRVPADAPAAAAPVIAAVTLIVAVGVMLRGSRALRALNAVLAIGAGCATAALFGCRRPVAGRRRLMVWLSDHGPARAGHQLRPQLWVLLPRLPVLTFVITIRQVGDSVRNAEDIESHPPGPPTSAGSRAGSPRAGSAPCCPDSPDTLPLWPYATGMALATGPGIAGATGRRLHRGHLRRARLRAQDHHADRLHPAAGAGSVPRRDLRRHLRAGDAGHLPGRRWRRPTRSSPGLSFWIGAGIQFGAIFPEHLATPTGRCSPTG